MTIKRVFEPSSMKGKDDDAVYFMMVHKLNPRARKPLRSSKNEEIKILPNEKGNQNLRLQ